MFSLAECFENIHDQTWTGTVSDTNGNSLTTDLCNAAHSTLANSSANLTHGDRIIICVNNDCMTVAILLAAWKLGLVVVPVKADMDLTSIQVIANDCNAKAVIKGEDVVQFKSWKKENHIFQINSERIVTGSDLALLIYTSGSTGKPKGIMLTHQNVITSLASISQYLRLKSHDKILCLSPLSFDYGLYQVLFSFFTNCSTLLFSQSFNPISVIKCLENETITVLPIVPTMASSLVKVAPILKPNLEKLRTLTNTGGHLTSSVIESWKALTPELNIFAMYGLSECKRALFLEPELWQEKIGSVGKPIPGLEAKIFNKNEQGIYVETQPHEVGELFVRGSAVMQSYFDPNVQGGSKIISGQYREDNWLSTGDLFCTDDDGYFYFKGRSKELIKQAGFCLYPKELEDLIDTCDLVSLSAVIPGKDKQGDEIALAAIQLSNNTEDNQKDFQLWLKTNIDKDYTPREIHFIDSLKLTSNSKVDKNHLQKELENS